MFIDTTIYYLKDFMEDRNEIFKNVTLVDKLCYQILILALLRK